MLTAIAASSIEKILEIARRPVTLIKRPSFLAEGEGDDHNQKIDRKCHQREDRAVGLREQNQGGN